MRVTALLFNPPGRGEFLREHIDMPDEGMPSKPEEFSARSVAAVKHFWPQANVSRAKTLARCDDGKRFVVEGISWSIEWATDQHKREVTAFVERYMAGQVSNDEFLAMSMTIAPVEVTDL